jgi:hypothetical protein
MGLKAEYNEFDMSQVMRMVGLGAIEGLVVMSIGVVVAYRLVGRPRSAAA